MPQDTTNNMLDDLNGDGPKPSGARGKFPSRDRPRLYWRQRQRKRGMASSTKLATARHVSQGITGRGCSTPSETLWT